MSKRTKQAAEAGLTDLILHLTTEGTPLEAATGRFLATGTMERIRDFVLAEEDFGRVNDASVYMIVLGSVARLFGARIRMQLSPKQAGGKLPSKLAVVMGQCVAEAALQAMRERK